MRRGNRIYGRIILYSCSVLGAAAMLLPFFWMVSTSLKPDREIFTMPIRWIPSVFYAENYVRAFQVVPVLRYLFNTFFLAILKITGEVLVSALVAYGFARFEFRGKNFLFMILLATMMLPYEVTMIPSFIMWTFFGLSSGYTPLILPAYFGSASFIFFIRMYYSAFPRALEEAMIIDGAGYLKIFFRLFIPLGKSALLTIALWSFVGTWNDLLGQLIYISDPAQYTIQLGLASFNSMTGETLWGPLMAASFAALIPVICVLLFAQRYFVEGIKMSGMKG
ncbi:MAG: carbohydrate ABC transporter permease [Treponema sp.]|jgi:multiple sugar transport system permease protein|nr:carbohydrate ABC transporter permease [Treponema sp.]